MSIFAKKVSQRVGHKLSMVDNAICEELEAELDRRFSKINKRIDDIDTRRHPE